MSPDDKPHKLTYTDRTEAKVVFFSPKASKSFYFEPNSDALKWSFSYVNGNPNSTSALKGIFHYNRDSDFFNKVPEHPIEAKFHIHAERMGGLSVHVTFYAPGSDEKDSKKLGEFFAKDPDNVIAGFDGRDDYLTGEWNVVHSDSLEDILRKKYEEREAKANVLFYKSGASELPSLHLTAGELGREFLHGVNPPTDPGISGNLFYNRGFFDQDAAEINADFFVEKKVDQSKSYLLIKFYQPGTVNAELLGEFLAEHLDNKSKDLLDQRKTGQWKLLPSPDLETELRAKYKNEQASDAMFYKGSEVPPSQSFHLEVYDRGWEFWDKSFGIGCRLPGLLFFNEPIFRDEDTEPIDTTYYIERKRGKPGYYALVKFYAPGLNDVVWCEFLAFDPVDRAREAGLLNKVLNGKWKKMNRFSAITLKNKESTQITLSTDKRLATMQCEHEDKIYGDDFYVHGILFSETPNNYGSFVRWYQDRAIFYKDGTAKYPNAYFFPEKLEHTLGSQDHLEMAVTWSEEEPHPEVYKTAVTFDIQSKWAAFHLQTPNAVIFPDASHPYPAKNTVADDVWLESGKSNTHEYQRQTLRFFVLNDGSPIDFAISHSTYADGRSRGKAIVTIEGHNYVNDEVKDNVNKKQFLGAAVSSKPVTRYPRASLPSSTWSDVLHRYLDEISGTA